MTKFFKYLKKVFLKGRPFKYLGKAFEELFDEAEDFFEDFVDVFKKKKIPRPLKEVDWFGSTVLVKPAYIFAEKIESLLKIIFGTSIFVSAILASLYGFASTSQLLKSLITSGFGRIVLVFVGFSYFTIGLWKLLKLPK
ncbi:hypothetical protein HN789_04170 [archaeon]|jgi:hypothetical protein|nr:hypothetical protein [archaeon]MBT4022480.1 hypothetical protein [archaeon]MBT4272319.1 hypothetical protein [archaeon]MBT4460428.1 hypothetical protein [archaeon]MBT4858447.1 hypothetical protein [archaeon]